MKSVFDRSLFDTTIKLKGKDAEKAICDAAARLAPKIRETSYDVTLEVADCTAPVHRDELKHSIARRIFDELRKAGYRPDPDYEAPRLVVAVELMGESAGIHLVRAPVP